MASPPAQPQAQPPTPPPDCLLHVKLDVKCARATHDFLRDIFPVPASEGRIFLLLPPGGQDSQDQGGDAVFVLPCVALRFTSSSSSSSPGTPPSSPRAQLAVLVDNVREVRQRLGRRGVRCGEEEDGLEWVEFSDPDGYRWRVARLVWGGV